MSGGNGQRKFSFSHSLSTTVKTPLQGHLCHNVWPCNQGFTVIQYSHLYHVQHAPVVVSKLFLVEETPFLVLGRHRFHATLPVFALQHDRLKEHTARKTLLRVNVLTLFLTVNESTSSLREFFGLLKRGYTSQTTVIITRMHSSRMRTVRCSGCLSGEGGRCLPRRVSARDGCLSDTPLVNRITDRCRNITLPQQRCGR